LRPATRRLLGQALVTAGALVPAVGSFVADWSPTHVYNPDWQVFDALDGVGIDVTDVFRTIENEGVEKFTASWAELAETVQGQLDSLTAG